MQSPVQKSPSKVLKKTMQNAVTKSPNPDGKPFPKPQLPSGKPSHQQEKLRRPNTRSQKLFEKYDEVIIKHKKSPQKMSSSKVAKFAGKRADEGIEETVTVSKKDLLSSHLKQPTELSRKKSIPERERSKSFVATSSSKKLCGNKRKADKEVVELSCDDGEEYPPTYAAAKRRMTLHDEKKSNKSNKIMDFSHIQRIDMTRTGQIYNVVSTAFCYFLLFVTIFVACNIFISSLLLHQETYDKDTVSMSDRDKKPPASNNAVKNWISLPSSLKHNTRR